MLAAYNKSTSSIPLVPVVKGDFENTGTIDANDLAWLKLSGFEANTGAVGFIKAEDNTIARIYVGVGEDISNPWWLAVVAPKLPEGVYSLENIEQDVEEQLSLGWALAQYQFDRYKSDPDKKVRCLMLSEGIDPKTVLAKAEAAFFVRDLVNTPAEDMGPSELQDCAEALAEEHGATVSTIVGDDLLDENFPMIHAVGRAASVKNAPRLINITWGREGAPKLCLVGKGVCFDSGGLDLKPPAGMLLMKKDMGGAAHVLGLAKLIMTLGLGVDLQVLIPAVENAVSGDSFRPGDVFATRKGISVEIGNTDAEGRLVLCDALALASENKPDLLIDFATLTGAARVALGPDLPATYTNNDQMWTALEKGGVDNNDPLWRMPLWAGYDQDLKSDIADMNNISEGPFAGSITAALYLQRFVDADIPWVHFDVFAWNPKPRAGRPKGGAAQGIFATYDAIIAQLGLDQ
ncbi:leucyl aminopeptidase family protein [Kordiimonas sp. SCSIO 12610]|nr:leucyl aminopeptidase family protein [Kordiimonas sp. SCSIO 12610]